MSWTDLARVVLNGVATQGRLLAASPQHFTFSGDGQSLYFLAPPQRETTSTLLKIDLKATNEQLATPTRVLNIEQRGKDARMFSREEELQRERQRVTSVGITSYDYHKPSSQLLFTSAGQLYRYKENSDNVNIKNTIN